MARENITGILSFKSAYSGFTNYAVNVYGTSIGSGKNVCLYSYDVNDLMQQFIPHAQGNNVYKLASVASTKIVLDHYRVTPVDNCDVYTSASSTSTGGLSTDLKDQQIYLEKTGSYYYIILYNGNGTKYYLTCSSTADGAGCSSPTSNNNLDKKNNIYWATYNSSLGNRQKWTMVLRSHTASDTILPHSHLYCQRDNTWSYLTTAGDFDSLGCAVCSTAMVAAIIEGDDSITPATMRDRGVFVYGDLTAQWHNISNNYTYTKVLENDQTNALLRIYSELYMGRPVIIRVQKTGYKHYVVANGLTSGTTSSNITPSNIIIMDPYNPEYTKLSDLLAVSTYLHIRIYSDN